MSMVTEIKQRIMKSRLIVSLILLVFMGSLVSCEKDYEVYNADLSAVRFMLDKNRVADSVVYSFALMPGVVEDTVDIPVQILGFTSEQDRQIKVEVVAELTTATEGTHFKVLPCSIPAGEISATQKVVVYKTADLEQKEVCTALRMVDSPDLVVGPANECNYRIILTNRLTKPADWQQYFGDYSEVKHRFIIEVTGQGTDFKAWEWMEVVYQMGLLNRALNEYNNTHPGEPLTDEFGVPVSFPVL